jgi:hypothetical protein
LRQRKPFFFNKRLFFFGKKRGRKQFLEQRCFFCSFELPTLFQGRKLLNVWRQKLAQTEKKTCKQNFCKHEGIVGQLL